MLTFQHVSLIYGGPYVTLCFVEMHIFFSCFSPRGSYMKVDAILQKNECIDKPM